jgi:hypothetical protein
MGWAAHYHAVAEERRCASQQKLRADVADGSNPVFEVMSAARPLFHRKRKSIDDLAMSHKCHNPTSVTGVDGAEKRRHRTSP